MKDKFYQNKIAIERKYPTFSGMILPVTKYLEPQEMSFLIDCGIVDVAENRVQSIVKKHALLGDQFRWHMIGRLQKNKVKKVVELCSLIHSVDSLSLAECIEKEAEKQNKKMPILLQVNVTQEESKQGFLIEDLVSSCEQIRCFSHVSIEGLMTIASLTDNFDKIRSVFSCLRKWTNLLKLKECSMGMSRDYHVACEEGATILRLGRVLFS